MNFLNPLYLLGLVFVSVPIIIHLWFRKRLRKVPFSSLMFLKTSEARRLRWLKLKEILVLAARCLLVAALFLALAKPQAKGRLFAANRLAAVYLIIDNSGSMAYGSNFKRAIELAQKTVENFSANSSFFIVPLCPDPDFSEPYWTTKNSAIEAIKKIELTFFAGPFVKVLEKYPAGETRLPLEYIYIGDGQETNFRDFSSTLLESRPFYWIKIPTGANTAVVSAVLKDPVAVPVDIYELVVNVENFSSRIWRGTVNVSAGIFNAEQDCEIQPVSVQKLAFKVPVNEHRGEIRISDDSLATDNVYFFSKLIAQNLDLLIVGESRFLSPALNPSGTANTTFKIATVSSLSEPDLRKYRVVVLSGIKEISAVEKVKLDNFLENNNAGIVCFIGDEAGPNLKNFISRAGRVDEEIILQGYTTVQWIDYDYAPFSVFQGNSSFRSIKFYRFHKIAADKGVVMKLENGYPLIVNQDNLTVVATQFKNDNTDIVYNPNFVPLLYRMCRGLVSRFPDKEFRVGDQWHEPGLPRSLSGEFISENLFSQPGFYTVEEETIAVNVAAEEGNLKPLGPVLAKTMDVDAVAGDIAAAGSDLSTLFLILAAVALIFEMVLLLL